MQLTKSYLIIILTVVLFLFLLGCKSKNEEMNKEVDQLPQSKELIKSEIENVRDSLLSFHNEERIKNKLEIFDLDSNLCEYAQNHANHMFSINRLIHSNISNVGAQFVAENIAYGQENEREVTKAWMNSYFHKMNIMNKRYNKIGFGYVNKDGKIYWCVVFTN